MTARQYFLILALLLLLVLPALAVPTAPSVSQVTAAGFNMSTTGASTTMWFRWGQDQQYPEYITMNQTAAGTNYQVVQGAPYYQGYTYYAMACDVTGCSAVSSPFVGVNPTPVPVPTYDQPLNNITQSHFNVMMIITNIPVPFMWALPAAWVASGTALALIAALVFSGYFVGIWMRQRKVVLAVMLGMITIGFLISPLNGFNWGLPAEWIQLAEMIMYAALAGMFYSLLKKG